MSFTFEVRVHQSASDWFDVVEETVFGHTGTGGTWTQVGDHRTLQVPLNSSGVLRFTNGAGVFVAFVVGVLGNQNVWTDVATNLAVGDTGVVMDSGDGVLVAAFSRGSSTLTVPPTRLGAVRPLCGCRAGELEKGRRERVRRAR